MSITWAAKTAAVLTTGLVIATASALPAASSEGSQPTRWCAALNMIVASPFYTDLFDDHIVGGGTTVSDGMDIAMGLAATKGNDGMFRAVGLSTAHASSKHCG